MFQFNMIACLPSYKYFLQQAIRRGPTLQKLAMCTKDRRQASMTNRWLMQTLVSMKPSNHLSFSFRLLVSLSDILMPLVLKLEEQTLKVAAGGEEG